MNAVEFIKDHGVEKAREAISNCCWMEKSYCTKLGHGCIKNNHDCCVDVEELKRLVESLDLIESCGGLAKAKWHLDSLECSCKYGGLESVRDNYKRLKKAIADYEAIGGEHV